MLVLGLGNPGKQYDQTRHNVGFSVLDQLIGKYDARFKNKLGLAFEWNGPHPPQGQHLLVKPLTYMNLSGRVLPYLFKKTSCTVEDLIVVVDNLDLPVGACRLKKGGGNAGHNGLKSIIQALGHNDFLRFYIGIGRPEHRTMVKSYVLQRFEEDELDPYQESLTKATESLLKLNKNNYLSIANEINRKIS